MYKPNTKTVILGKKVLHLPCCHSTNDIAADLIRAGTASDGDIVIADYQTSGRGQINAKWEAAPSENLTLSIILDSAPLRPEEIFRVSEATALGVVNYLNTRLNVSADIKWPNDVLVQDKKICGILIENKFRGSQWTNSVIGIGVNINQIQFSNPRAGSLATLTGKQSPLSDEFPLLISHLDRSFNALRSGLLAETRQKYTENLLGLGKWRQYITSDSHQFAGKITGINSGGLLVIETEDGRTREFGNKEIEWIWD